MTYGCYGYVDPDGYLRVTHYVADSHGYRIIEPEKPVEVFPEENHEYDEKYVYYSLLVHCILHIGNSIHPNNNE